MKQPEWIRNSGSSWSWFGNASRAREKQTGKTVDRYHALGKGDYVLANCVSYRYDFRGPSGVCRTFDAKADGYGRGEAINVLYIKRLSSAKQANDPIRAVIRSTAVNYDGKTSNISAPSVQSQESLIRNAYQKAGIDELLETAFVECHGTGTVAGDAAETTAIDNCFKPSGVVIGAVKPNFGHSEGASGITSLIKAILSLENSTIPPNIHVNTLNAQILESSLTVPLEPMKWPADRLRRVSINGFGIGGPKAHVVLDSAADFRGNFQDPQISESVDGAKLLVVSAQSSKSLEGRIEQKTAFVPPSILCGFLKNSLAIFYVSDIRRSSLTSAFVRYYWSRIPMGKYGEWAIEEISLFSGRHVKA
ncbi:hypothetical protein AtubIFM57258_011080 [Aspergillus tubingensis]|nr:hypothetical protein AtubIFM57258_011080 [Aspergillus tubingensis]